MSTFKDVLSEIVEYRLHRYLKGKELPSGEILQIFDDASEAIDARFLLHTFLSQPIGVLFKAAGADLNKQYVHGLDLLLQRLATIGAVVNDAYVDSGVVRTLPISDRRLGIPKDLTYPIELSILPDLVVLRKSVLNSMASIGQSPTAQAGGGNSRKALTLLLGNIQQYSADKLSKYLAGQGPPPVSTATNSDVA